MAENMLKQTNIKALALRNFRGRYYIPGKMNLIDDFEYENVMFDSGSASVLLPIPKNCDFQMFLKKYEKFPWSIGLSGGTGVLNSCTLSIDKGTYPEFVIKLDGAQIDFKTDFLRFQINGDEATELIKICKNKFTDKEVKALGLYAFVIKKNNEMFPALKMGLPRRDVLLGQTILQKYPFIQFDNLQVLVDTTKNFEWNSFILELFTLKKEKIEFIEGNWKEFWDLEDQSYVSDNFECMKHFDPHHRDFEELYK